MIAERTAVSGEVDARLRELLDNVSLRRAFRAASSEGRLDPTIARHLGMPTGSVRCVTCGMLHWDETSAAECCELPDENRERALRSPPVGTVAQVVDAVALVEAFDAVWKARGLGCRHYLSVQVNIYPGFWTKALSGGVRWLSMQTWLKLTVLFDGKVPGCREWAGTQEAER